MDINQQPNKNICDESIVLIGPIGSGKTIISQELSYKTGKPVVCMDLMRNCPKSLNVINFLISKNRSKVAELTQELNKVDDDLGQKEINKTIEKLNRERAILHEQHNYRKMFPTVPNYEDMGFNPKISDLVNRTFGAVAWHFYQKQFEIQLLDNLIAQAKEPTIFDCGGGAVISLDKEYKVLSKKFSHIDKTLYRKNMNEKIVSENNIKKILEPMKNVIYLRLPENYKFTNDKAREDCLNDRFIASGQFDKLAKKTVVVDGLVEKDEHYVSYINYNKLEDYTDKIINLCSKENEYLQ